MSPKSGPEGLTAQLRQSAQREDDPGSTTRRPGREAKSGRAEGGPAIDADWRTLQPPGWAAPKGYANGVAARGTTIFVGGQIGWNAQQQFETDDFVAQARTALANIVAVLREAGAGPQHITRMTWYVVDRDEYVASYPDLGRAYRDVIGRHFPAMTAVVVAALVEPRARVEIEATAVLPDSQV